MTPATIARRKESSAHLSIRSRLNAESSSRMPRPISYWSTRRCSSISSRRVLQRGPPKHVKKRNQFGSRLRTRIVAEPALAPERGGITVFLGSTSHQPPQLLSVVDYDAVGVSSQF